MLYVIFNMIIDCPSQLFTVNMDYSTLKKDGPDF